MVFGKLKSNPDRPDMLGLERAFLPNDTSFVPSGAKCANGSNGQTTDIRGKLNIADPTNQIDFLEHDDATIEN